MISTFSDVYKQYKKDTEFVSGWLAEESLKCGYKLVTRGDKLLRTTGRHKGKARTQAKHASADKASHGESYVIKCTDFILMAQKIVEHNPKFVVPRIVEHKFRRAISERRRISDWFKSCHGTNPEQDSDHRHLHFIDVLSSAFATLRPYTEAKVKSGQPRKPKPVHAETLDLRNAFSGLTVEETTEPGPNDESEPIRAESNEKPLEVASITFDRTEAEREEDFFFAIQCFLEEMQATRSELKDEWNHCKCTAYDLVTATIMTNTAIELIRKAEEQLELLIERPAKYPAAKFPVWTFPAIVFYDLHKSMHSCPIEKAVLPSERMTSTGNSTSTCLHTDWCLHHTYSGIKYYLHLTRKTGRRAKDALPAVSKEDFSGMIDEKTWRALEWTTILRAATIMSSSISAIDEITRGIRHAFATWTVPVWVSFGMQILLDIQDIFQTCIDWPYKDLRAHLEYASEMLVKDLDYQEPFFTSEKYHAIVDQTKNILKDIHSWTVDDQFNAMLRMQPDLQSNPIIGKIFNDANYLLRHHPLRCGMLKYSIYFLLNETGYELEVETLNMTMMAHLYTACKISYPSDHYWTDMELFLKLQLQNRLFHGGIPRDYKEAQMKLALAVGYSPVAFSKNRRCDESVVFTHNSRIFVDLSFLNWYYRDRILTEQTTEEATELTRKFMQTMRPSLETREFIQTTKSPPETSSRPAFRSGRTSQPRKQNREWSQLEILTELRGWQAYEEPHMHVSVHRMNRTCAEIWAKIKAYLDQKPDIPSFDRSNCVRATCLILQDAVMWEDVFENKKGKKERRMGMGPAHPPLITAVRKFIIGTAIRKDMLDGSAVGLLGDVCLRRLAHVFPHATHGLMMPEHVNPTTSSKIEPILLSIKCKCGKEHDKHLAQGDTILSSVLTVAVWKV